MVVYDFHPVIEEDFPLLHWWHNQPWVADNWDGPHTFERVVRDQTKKMSSARDFAFIVCCDGRPIAYMQCQDCSELSGDWLPDEPPGTWGVDTFIGEEDCLDKGYGSAFVHAFAGKLFRDMGAKKVIIDPRPDNIRAIRAYEKAGFRAVREITTPDGRALLMEIHRSDWEKWT